MNYRIIPCAEGDDEIVADKLKALTDAGIAFEDAVENELVVYKVNDGSGSVIAGCNLIVNCWKVAELDILWVAEEYRRRGLGSALIRAAERAARERGCRFMTLGTFDFQARPLYEKLGFAVCGTIEDCPTKGHTHYDMIKTLAPLDESPSDAPCAVEIVPGTEDDAEYLDDRLVEYNWSQVPAARDFAWIGRKIRGEHGETVAAGFVGVNFWNIAFLELLWVDEPCRERGMGSCLLAELEREAQKDGAFLVMLEARDWNVEFFRKHGYSVYCTLENCSDGHKKYNLQKRLF